MEIIHFSTLRGKKYAHRYLNAENNYIIPSLASFDFYLLIKLIVVYQMSRTISNIENLCQQEMEVL